MAGSTSKRAAVPEYQAPPPAGALPHEKPSWLPDLPVPFLAELRDRHRELAFGWASAVDAIGAARDQHADLEAEYRAAVRSAVSVGDPPPARSAGLDPAIWAAHVAVAVEDATRARDLLSAHVLETLAALRAHRGDLHPYFASFSPALLSALSTGAANVRAVNVERMRRALAEIEADSPSETFTDASPAATSEISDKEGAHA